MNKQEFLERLRKGLVGLPQNDIEERVNFYSEMIDDRVEDGLSEEEATSKLGAVEDIIAQIIEDVPLTKIVKERLRQKRTLKGWEISLLIIGSPIWGTLLISAIAVIFSLYVSLWAVVVSAWAVFVSLAVCPIAGIVAGLIFIFTSHGASGLATIGVSVVCAGLAVFAFFGCILATKGTAVLAKNLITLIKNCFIKKEANNE